MPGPSGIYQEYDGVIPSKRIAGATLQEIADYCGVSKQRVDQVLKQYYPNAKPDRITSHDVSIMLGMSCASIFRLIRRGVISPTRSGKVMFSFSKEDIKKLSAYFNKPCKHCGKPKPPRSSAYCKECAAEAYRNHYKFLSDEGKKKYGRQTSAWAKRNPDKMKPIQARAMKRYREKGKIKMKVYVIKPMGEKGGGLISDDLAVISECLGGIENEDIGNI